MNKRVSFPSVMNMFYISNVDF